MKVLKRVLLFLTNEEGEHPANPFSVHRDSNLRRFRHVVDEDEWSFGLEQGRLSLGKPEYVSVVDRTILVVVTTA